MADNKEKDFEQDLEECFVQNGWQSVKFKEISFDTHKGYSPQIFLEFVKQTQEKSWVKLEKIFKERAETKLFDTLESQIHDFGLLDVLRKGIKFTKANTRIKVLFLPDDSQSGKLNVQKNIFQIVRQFYYNGKDSVDVVLMVNGLPLFGLELKTPQTGQNYSSAVKQWKKDRLPTEPIFRFNQRMLVFFALDPYHIEMTTKLEQDDTYFLPFNQGSNGAGADGGAGNPVVDGKYPVHYLWNDVLRPEMILTIISDYMKLERKTDKKTRTQVMDKLIFPRYHQLDVVRKLANHVYENGSGKNYLIQHSAGSGKVTLLLGLLTH